MQVVMDCLKMNVCKRRRDRSVVALFAKRAQWKYLCEWRIQFEEEKAKVRTFYLLFLAIKNELAGRAMKALYRNMKLRKAKRLAAGFRDARL